MDIIDLPYDKTDPRDIERYAKKLEGKTFYEVINDELNQDLVGEGEVPYINPNGKGELGNLLEEHFFFYKPNNDSAPDFIEAGVELKVTPYEITKSKKIRAGERLVIGMIPNREPIESDFYKSHLLYKMQLMLLIFYLREKNTPRLFYKIDYVILFSILSEACKEDLEIIADDYAKITNKIISGRAHELSESDTRYLGACTKGSSAKASLQPQYYNSEIPAKRRAFSLKQGYMTYVINNYVLKNIETYDSMFTAKDLEKIDFDNEVLNRINKFIGKSEEEIYNIFNIDKNNKQKNNNAVCRMLGVKSDKVAEFEKADIKIKTIRIKSNGMPKESMSFPGIKIKEFINETFEDSELYRYFTETRFLFVVFRENKDGKFILRGSKFWNMPITELETIGKDEWSKYRNKFISGVNFKKKVQKNGIIITNDLPKKKDTLIFHMRPHTSKSAYLIKSLNYKAGLEKDMDELPNGDKMTKQCFWLNSDYIKDIVSDIK